MKSWMVDRLAHNTQADGKGGGEQKPADQKPAEQKPAGEQKPAEQKAAEQKPAEQKPGAEGSEGKASKDGTVDDQKPKAPEKYELKVPDGGDVYVDDADLTLLQEMARKADWSNDDAQAALDEHVATVKAQSERYAAETKADKTYGGDHLKETQRLTTAGIDAIFPQGDPMRDSFIKFLARGGAGNKLEVVVALARVGKMVGEDRPIREGSGAKPQKTAAEVLYGDSAKPKT